MTIREFEIVDQVDQDALLRVWNCCKDDIIANNGPITYEQMLFKFTEKGSMFMEGKTDGVISFYIAGVLNVSTRTYTITNALAETPGEFVTYAADLLYNKLKEANIHHIVIWGLKDNTTIMDIVDNKFARDDLYQFNKKVISSIEEDESDNTINRYAITLDLI